MESFTSTWVCITTRRWRPQKSRVSSTCVWRNGTYDFLAQIRVLLTAKNDEVSLRSASQAVWSPMLDALHLLTTWDHCWWGVRSYNWMSPHFFLIALLCSNPSMMLENEVCGCSPFLNQVVFSRVGWTKPAEFVEKHFQHMYHTNKIVSSVYGSVVKISCASLNVHHSN